MVNHKIGISQGRLIKPPNNELQWFPGSKWKDEFYIAKEIGINHIEFLAESHHNPLNPLWSKQGIEEINQFSKKNKIVKYSACLDYIISNKLNDGLLINQKHIDYTKNFINSCSELGLEIIILPFLGKNSLNYENLNFIKKFLNYIVPYAYKKNILISIESLAGCELIIELLEEYREFSAGCVYDTGNRILLTKNQEEDIIKLSKFINHVHIKDKNNSNENVVLGQGNVNFKEIFSGLKKIKYKGLFTMETNRGKDPKNTAIKNIELIKKFMNQTNFND